MKLSRYARVVPLDSGERCCLANTVNKALVAVPSDRVDGTSIVEGRFSDDELAVLRSLGFFLSDEEGERLARTMSHSSRRVSVSIELSLACNLRCPYCYQGLDKVSRQISPDVLDEFSSWVARLVTESDGVEELVVKVLGGEPSIMWSTVDPTLRKVSALCRETGIRFVLMVDTNGCLVEAFLGLDYPDKLLFTIPVTHPSCHDSVRKTVAGEGTYDLVLRNVSRLQREYPAATIVLRHNTDEHNAPLFGDYLDDLAERGFTRPLVDLSYTASFENTSYRNGMTYPQYQAWRTEKAIPVLLDHGFPVLASPTMNLNPCQRLEEHSFKLFSDGTVGYCAMDFFAEERAGALVALRDPESTFFANRPTLPEKCARCASFFLCGGSCMLPCISSLGVETCAPDGAFNIAFDEFVRLYMAAPDKSLFVVFNQDEIVR